MKQKEEKVLNLEVIKDVFQNIKENKKVQGFLKELSEYLESSVKNNLEEGAKKLPIIESILEQTTLATGNENAIRFRRKGHHIRLCKRK